MKYGYARVSTKLQDLESQTQALHNEDCQEIVSEKFTGTTTDRPVFSKLMEVLQDGDTLVVTKLDRLARNTKEGIEIVERLFAKGVKVHVLNVGLLENTTMGKFFLQTMLAVAEMERNMIIERTQEGREIARQHPDYREGRPNKFGKKHIEQAFKLKHEGMSWKMVSEATGISEATLYREWRKVKALEKQ